MSDVHILYIDNDMVLEVSGLRDEPGGGFVNDAAVTVTLNDADGAPVAGGVWPLTVAYIAGSRGIYRAPLASVLDLAPAARYLATVTVDAGIGLRAQWVLDCVCATRR